MNGTCIYVLVVYYHEKKATPIVIDLLVSLLLAAPAGFLAAVLITVVELPFWKRWGMSGVAEWQVNQVLVSKLLKKSNARYSVASHLFHGTILGGVFRAILFYFPSGNEMLILTESLVFSLILWLITPLATKSLFENAGGIKITRIGIVSSLTSHLVYGIALGLLLQI